MKAASLAARAVVLTLLALTAGGCPPPTAEEAEAFLAEVEQTGTRDMDATAILDYFAPLAGWLEAQNAGRQCGW